MSAILDQVVENSNAPSSKTDGWVANLTRLSSRPSVGVEIQTAFRPTQHDFGNTLTQTGNKDGQHASSSFTGYMDRFDGLRIPSSPLHEY